MSLNIKQEVARMKSMPTAELRDHFETVCLEPPRSRNRDWMIKKIAWRLQANEQGGLPERVRQRALAMADDVDLRKRPPQSFTDQISLAVEQTTVRRRTVACSPQKWKKFCPISGFLFALSYGELICT